MERIPTRKRRGGICSPWSKARLRPSLPFTSSVNSKTHLAPVRFEVLLINQQFQLDCAGPLQPYITRALAADERQAAAGPDAERCFGVEAR